MIDWLIDFLKKTVICLNGWPLLRGWQYNQAQHYYYYIKYIVLCLHPVIEHTGIMALTSVWPLLAGEYVTPSVSSSLFYFYFIFFIQPLSIHCRRWPQHAFPITCWFWAYPSTLAKGYYISWYYMHMYCEGNPLNISTLTLHQPQTFSHLFLTHFCMCSIADWILWRTFGNYCCCVSLLGGNAIRCQWCSLDPLDI